MSATAASFSRQLRTHNPKTVEEGEAESEGASDSPILARRELLHSSHSSQG